MDDSEDIKPPLALDKLFECKDCSETFTDQATLRDHQTAGGKLLLCDFCPMIFPHQCSLKLHKKTHMARVQFDCDVCKKTFSSTSYLKRHRSQLHPETHPFLCTFCRKRFIRQATYEQHVKTHTEIKPFACLACDEKFSQREELIRHRRVHTGEKVHNCNFCIKTFPTAAKRNTHEKKSHVLITTDDGEQVEETDHVCSLCGKVFSRLAHLATHLRSHENEANPQCCVCKERFDTKESLKLHKKVHYKCDICGKTFSSMGNLNLHQKIHQSDAPFTCEVCGKKFGATSLLLRHAHVHMQEKFHVCELCGTSCTSKHELQEHIHQHTGELPFSCPNCPETFISRSAVSKHTKKCHLSKQSLRNTNTYMKIIYEKGASGSNSSGEVILPDIENEIDMPSRNQLIVMKPLKDYGKKCSNNSFHESACFHEESNSINESSSAMSSSSNETICGSDMCEDTNQSTCCLQEENEDSKLFNVVEGNQNGSTALGT